MAIIALVSARGSPGATTAGLAFTLTWGSRTILAECDPAGGTVLAGYLRGSLPASRGLLPLAVAELRHPSRVDAPPPDEFFGQLVDLDAPHRQRMLMPGLSDPAQAGTLMPLWGRFGQIFARLDQAEPGFDVIADCGRIVAPYAPWPLLWAASVVLLVVQPTLTSVSAAVPAARAITTQLLEHTGTNTALGLLVTGSGPYRPEQVARQLDVPLTAVLPHDAKTAEVLTHGGDIRLGRPLIRAANAAERPIREAMDAHRRALPNRAAPRGVFPHAR